MILTPEQPTLALHARNAAQSARPEVWRGLVGAWVPSLGYQGSRLIDVSGNKNHGTLNGDPQWTSWMRGQALIFDGNVDYIDTGLVPPVGASPRTVSVWVYIDGENDTEPAIFWWGSGEGGASGTDFKFNGEKDSNGDFAILFRHQGGNLRYHSGVLVKNKWHHVVAIVPEGAQNTSDVNVYLDAILDTGTRNAGFDRTLDTASGHNALFGSWDRAAINNAEWSGRIDNARIYNRALTPSEIRTLYIDPLAPFRLRDDTALATAAMLGGTTTPSVTLPPPLFNMQMTGSF